MRLNSWALPAVADVLAGVRRMVFARAAGKCEYCLISEVEAGHPHEPDHIIPIQHGGAADLDNLALACALCNRFKGPNVASYDPDTGALVAFFHPRRQAWPEHFGLEDGVIQPKTAEGRVTALILKLNLPARINERRRLIANGLYP